MSRALLGHVGEEAAVARPVVALASDLPDRPSARGADHIKRCRAALAKE